MTQQNQFAVLFSVVPASSVGAPAATAVPGVRLQLSSETVNVPTADLRGRTVSQLFADNAAALSFDLGRAHSFRVNGTVVTGSHVPTEGSVVVAAADAEDKGTNNS